MDTDTKALGRADREGNWRRQSPSKTDEPNKKIVAERISWRNRSNSENETKGDGRRKTEIIQPSENQGGARRKLIIHHSEQTDKTDWKEGRQAEQNWRRSKHVPVDGAEHQQQNFKLRGQTEKQGYGRHTERKDSDRRSEAKQYEHTGARPKRLMAEVGNRTDRRPNLGLSQRKLGELLAQDPNTLLLTISSPNSGFAKNLQHANTEENVILLILKILVIATSENHSPQSVLALFDMCMKSHFLLTTVTSALSKMLTEEINVEVIKYTIQFMTRLIGVLPNASTPSTLAVNAQLKMLLSMKEEEMAPLKEDIEAIESLADLTKQQIRSGHVMPDEDGEKMLQPPDDFRKLSVIPIANDLKKNTKPFLRKNVVKGKYENTDHYLDVQFRLLYEDFIAPLRDGVQEILKMKKEGKDVQSCRFQDVRVYHKVHIQLPVATPNGIRFRVQFDVSRMKRVRWESSKRLIFGSLVCLSKDNFDNVLFGTVAERNPSDLENGIIFITFEGISLNMMDANPYDEFQMVESSSYFEAYRHNLEGLQETKEETLPLQKYIIKADNSTVNPPSYLLTSANAVKYNFGCLTEKENVIDSSSEESFDSDSSEEYHYAPETSDEGSSDDFFSDGASSDKGSNGKEIGIGKELMKTTEEVRNSKSFVPVLNTNFWPAKEDLEFDESQYKAFQAALTKEFAVIQGPPGTGKTFIGLKILQLLLANARVWNRDTEGNTRPILVVCYTNHALDQFLEGILKFQTQGVIRIGRRSSSDDEAMQRCQLWYLKREYGRLIEKEIGQNKYFLKDQLDSFSEAIAEVANEIHHSGNGVINERVLMHFMTEQQMRSLAGTPPGEPSIMLRWLFGLKPLRNLYNPNRNETKVEDEALNETTEPSGTDKQEEEKEEKEAEKKKVEKLEEEDEEAVKAIEALRMTDLEENQQTAGKMYEKMEANMTACQDDILLTVEQFDNAIKEKDFNDPVWRLLKQVDTKSVQSVRQEMQSFDTMKEDRAMKVKDIWKLCLADRWRLYKHWISKYTSEKILQIRQYYMRYHDILQQLEDIRNEEDYLILQGCKVIAMTTTGAAKYRRILQRVAPRIVVVEEAAEVLEAHIVTTLSRACEHLILIGDHQQLRPNPSVYNLAKEYHLDISLFERMIKNKMQCNRLDIQHRMRPEICELIVPHVYSHLENHDSVKEYGNIKGVDGNLYFITHKEEELRVEDTKSKANLHEAEFIVSFCRYLLMQGYDKSQITVLTTYNGQMFQMRKLMPREEFMGVRVTPVDNYQGEENDIILLSLVRSNEEGTIGFLKVSNRVCVALSRAKKGFYVIGNMELLGQESPLWRGILKDLKKKGKVVESLPLKCQNHADVMTHVKMPCDFMLVPEGGCLKPCDFRLPCEHVCGRKCHSDDLAHTDYKCMNNCNNRCSYGHNCLKKCCKPCGGCIQQVDKTLPCDHIMRARCFENVQDLQCISRCEKILDCGHQCSKRCSQECDLECQKIIPDRKWPCGHILEMECWKMPETFPCPILVDKVLDCNHPFKMACSENPASKICRRKLQLTLSCDHVFLLECCNILDMVLCPVKVMRKLPCGHNLEMACSDDLGEKLCKVKVDITLSCGHLSKIECHKTGDSLSDEVQCYFKVIKQCHSNVGHAYEVACSHKLNAVCPFPCYQMLPCGHFCYGSCATCNMQGHNTCQVPCPRPLICSHKCHSICGKPCPPCQNKCAISCGHQICNHPCEEPCTPCKKPCDWTCPHRRCDGYCYEVCYRPPCSQPCPKLLPCGHPCIGYCGEPCPQFCFWHNASYFHDIGNYFHKQITVATRFVCLSPCGHIVDTDTMDRRVSFYERRQNGFKIIRHVMCPLCPAPVRYCPRYNKVIKSNLEDMNRIRNIIQDENLQKSKFADSAKNIPVFKKITDELQGQNVDPFRYELLQVLMNCVFLWTACEEMKKAYRPRLRLFVQPNHAIMLKVGLVLKSCENLIEEAFVDPSDMEKLVCELKKAYIIHRISKLNINENRAHMCQLGGDKLLECTPTYTMMAEAICEVEANICEHLQTSINFEYEIEVYLESKVMQIINKKWIKCRRDHIFAVDARVKEKNITCSKCLN